METDDNEIPDVNNVFKIEPYQFEPLRAEKSCDDRQNSDSEDSDIDDEEAIQVEQRLHNTAWCECGNCSSMTTMEECVCCAEIDLVHYKTETADQEIHCIIEHESFIANCLNRHVLHVSMYEYLENVGPFDDNDPIHEIYRHIAYRRFVRWIWHRLGRHNRKILPSCVVQKIRETFPSEQYCGFRYPRV
ncbi:P2X purinoceptor 7-like [Argopecten irradians]|uniref:P2X purinoceptor 7-like n=1 Tax=Argopecten irradians TaxID=31199 RepID=UPI003712B876